MSIKEDDNSDNVVGFIMQDIFVQSHTISCPDKGAIISTSVVLAVVLCCIFPAIAFCVKKSNDK